MISLFLNTSSNYLNIAINKDGVVIDEFYERLDRDLSREALFNVKCLLDKNGILPNEVDEIYSVSGPGSFTGLRVGVTISKTFAYFLNKRLYEVSNLFVMATSVSAPLIVPVIDARRGFVYAGIYDSDYNTVMEEGYIKLDELIEKVKEYNKKYKFVSYDKFDLVPVCEFRPNIENFFKYYKKRLVNPLTYVPNYLKRTEAEEKRNG